MLLNTWIIQKNGSLIFHKCFNPLDVDNDLLSGFLSAMESFVKEITHEGVKNIVLKEMKFSYAWYDDLMFIILTGEKDNDILIRELLVRIKQNFNRKYRESLINFNHNIAVFRNFELDLDLLIKDKDLEITCATCGKIIPERFLIKKLGSTFVYFCCLSCQKDFNYKKEISPALRTELEEVILVCKKCRSVLNMPFHCEKPMHIDVINGKTTLVCWMGSSCNVQIPPKHCDEVMELEYLEHKTYKTWRKIFELV